MKEEGQPIYTFYDLQTWIYLFRRWLLVQDTFLMYVNTDTGESYFWITSRGMISCFQHFEITFWITSRGMISCFQHFEKTSNSDTSWIACMPLFSPVFCICICLADLFICLYIVANLLFSQACPHTQTQHDLYAAIECNNEQANNSTRITSFRTEQI